MKEWLAQHEDNARLLVEESFILDATDSIWDAMNKKKLSKSELAQKAKCSRPYISQVLSGSRNMTLRTYAQLAFAMGLRPCIKLEEENAKVGDWEDFDPVTVGSVVGFLAVRRSLPAVVAANYEYHDQVFEEAA